MTNTTEIDSEPTSGDSSNLEAADYAALDEAVPVLEPISYSGTDFDVEGLVRRLERKDVVVPSFGHGDPTIETAGFQRDFVWRKPQMDRFIESLLLGYPVPGIFLVQQQDKRYLVLDGQQRLRTLAHFYEGTYAQRVFSLDNVADDFKGLTYKNLSDTQRRTLNNSFIQAIVVKTDGTAPSLESIYQIFERLNSGGTQLTGHEIRVALYAGPFIDFVVSLNSQPAWRTLYGPTSPRLRDQELILRILALFVTPGTYKRPLKKFLNDFVGHNRDCSLIDIAYLTKTFMQACESLLPQPGPASFRYASNQVNVAMTEAVMVGMMRRLQSGAPVNPNKVATILPSLITDQKFVGAITRATADEDNVKVRIAIASQTLAGV